MRGLDIETRRDLIEHNRSTRMLVLSCHVDTYLLSWFKKLIELKSEAL